MHARVHEGANACMHKQWCETKAQAAGASLDVHACELRRADQLRRGVARQRSEISLRPQPAEAEAEAEAACKSGP